MVYGALYLGSFKKTYNLDFRLNKMSWICVMLVRDGANNVISSAYMKVCCRHVINIITINGVIHHDMVR